MHSDSSAYVTEILAGSTTHSAASDSNSNSTAPKGPAHTPPGKAINQAHGALLVGRFAPDGDALLFEWPHSSIRHAFYRM